MNQLIVKREAGAGGQRNVTYSETGSVLIHERDAVRVPRFLVWIWESWKRVGGGMKLVERLAGQAFSEGHNQRQMLSNVQHC